MGPTVDATPETPFHVQSVAEVVAVLQTDVEQGLTSQQVADRLRVNGPNVLPAVARDPAWRILLTQWLQPMSLMLTVVAAASFLIGQVATGWLVVILVLINLILGTRQEIAARASMDALASMQVPLARVRREGVVQEVPAAELVPGDVILVEAGDLVPADGRLAVASRLEAAESSLTGESAPVPKDSATLDDPDAALGDRSCLLFQNTSVTRGTGVLVVTQTGAQTQMGRIAGMLGSVRPAASPLQREVRSLTIRLAVVAWIAVAIIGVLGFARGLDPQAVVLLGITTAIASIPSGLPTFLTGMLSFGAQRLARAHAIVKSLNDVETLGSTTAINSDKTGTLTMDMMTATRVYTDGQWLSVSGSGYSTEGSIRHAAGRPVPDLTMLAYGLALCGDAVLDGRGGVVGDPTEAALVVLAAKVGVDATISRREYPRLAEVPFDSAYKFMATVHEVDVEGAPQIVVLVKGAPDVVLARSAGAWRPDGSGPSADDLAAFAQANEDMARDGLRVMAFGGRVYPESAREQVVSDPMAAVTDLDMVALVGIIDPLRPSAQEAISVALGAGIDVRMITGDHAITARAIAADLGLGPGLITGPEMQRMDDGTLLADLPNLHVFGRVSPEDKLRMVELLQRRGDVVAMTGDAVNDAAALKKADIGVAMGSGSDVTKQAAKMILLDDNFATLVHAIELGRDIYGKVSAQIRFVLVGLFGLIGIMLGGSLLNLNDGDVLSPVQLLFVSFLIGIFPAIALSTDVAEPDLMRQPPRPPGVEILSKRTAPLWLLFGLTQTVVSLVPFVWQSSLGTTTVQTMTFATLALSTIWLAASIRRERLPIWAGPFVPFWLWMVIPLVLTVLAVQWSFLQEGLQTVSLDGAQWLVIVALSAAVPIVIETAKAIARERGIT